jgi:uncharacterized protein YycO
MKKFPTTAATDYAALRPELRSGDLLLCSGTGWFSKMIQGSTRSEWSHVACILRLEAIDRIMVLESLESVGVRTVPLSKYLHNYDSKGNRYPGRMCLARHRDVADCGETLAQFGHFAVDQLGTPYDNQMIAKIAARITMTHLLDANERAAQIQDWQAAGLERNQEYICSELVWECYQRLGLDIPHDPLGFVAPKDFAADPKIECLGVLS